MIEIKNARKGQAADIARLIMTAMTDDCCLHFCGVGYGLEDFRGMMTMLVEREDSQYSYRNTLVAMDGAKLVGIAVSYDGGRLHELRKVFIQAAKEQIGKDNSGMDDETQAGELYLDSLAVLPGYRRQGIARRLLKATKEKALRMSARHCPATAESYQGEGPADGTALRGIAGGQGQSDRRGAVCLCRFPLC